MKLEGAHVAGYVIMPNHLHALIYLTHAGTSLNNLVSEGKRFMAYAIVKGLKKDERHSLLKILNDGVDKNERLKGKKHQVFTLSFDARPCIGDMVNQKLDYIHHNPVRGKWNLVEDFTQYAHSSAAFYETGQHNAYVTHYEDLL